MKTRKKKPFVEAPRNYCQTICKCGKHTCISSEGHIGPHHFDDQPETPNLKYFRVFYTIFDRDRWTILAEDADSASDEVYETLMDEYPNAKVKILAVEEA